jgi:hypothetical protein
VLCAAALLLLAAVAANQLVLPCLQRLPTDRHPNLHINSGVNVKTRKRNIVVPSDPGSFADAIVQIFNDAAEEGQSIEKNLEAGVKVLDSAELDFSRYADTLFEVLFAGGRLATGGNLADEEKEKLATNVSCMSSYIEVASGHGGVLRCWLRCGGLQLCHHATSHLKRIHASLHAPGAGSGGQPRCHHAVCQDLPAADPVSGSPAVARRYRRLEEPGENALPTAAEGR